MIPRNSKKELVGRKEGRVEEREEKKEERKKRGREEERVEGKKALLESRNQRPQL